MHLQRIPDINILLAESIPGRDCLTPHPLAAIAPTPLDLLYTGSTLGFLKDGVQLQETCAPRNHFQGLGKTP